MKSAIAFLAGLALAACQWLIYNYAPVEATLGPVQKIFYMHLPLAIWAMASFLVVFAGSIAWLIWRRTGIDHICEAAAEIGVLFSGLALASGIIWARKSWGVWWTWDPRLTTTLIMWFLYCAYLVFRHIDIEATRKRTICAILGIAAFLDVPLVFVSARMFRSIHPAVIGAGGGLEPEMRLTAIASVAACGLLWLALLLIRQEQLNLGWRLRKLRIQLENGE